LGLIVFGRISERRSPVVLAVKSILRLRVVQVALMGVALMAGWVASAGADPTQPLLTLPTVTLPTVTLPTVTLPTVTLPTVTTPTVTVPPVPPPPPVPPAPPTPTVPGLTLPSGHPPPPGHGGSGGSSGGGGSQGSGGSAGAGSGAAGQSAGGTSSSRESGTSTGRVDQLRLARDWISSTGPHRHRQTTLLFILPRPSLVEFVVLEVAPECRRVGRFRVPGHRGVNRVRIPARVGREPLAPGTYRVVARAIPGGRTVGRARLVVVDRNSRGQIRAARRASACAQGSNVGASDPPRPPAGAVGVAARPKSARHPERHHGVLGTRFTKSALSAAEDVPLWVYALLALGVALLAAAAALPKGDAADLSMSLLLGLVGAAILLGLTIVYAFG
jgi:hypothetical protein